MSEKKTITLMKTITLEEYIHLKERSDWLYALEAAGVDNWGGYDYARELLNQDEDEDDEFDCE